VRDILGRNPRVLKDPTPAVGVTTLGDSSINIAVKPWVAVNDFGAAGAEINLAIVEEFRLKRIEIPFSPTRNSSPQWRMQTPRTERRVPVPFCNRF